MKKKNERNWFKFHHPKETVGNIFVLFSLRIFIWQFKKKKFFSYIMYTILFPLEQNYYTEYHNSWMSESRLLTLDKC